MLLMVVKRMNNPLCCFLRHLFGSLVFAAVISVSNSIVDSTEWQPWIMQIVVCLICSVIFAALKYHCRRVKENHKQNFGQKPKANVYDADYHRMCESQTRLSRDCEASKRTIADLKEENRKLKKDKDLALAQMTKKHAKELHMKDEALKREQQNQDQANLRQRDEIKELTNELNEANNQLLALNGQLFQRQQQSDALTDQNQKLESKLHGKESELSKQQENIDAYKNKVSSLEDELTKRNEKIVSLENHLNDKNLELRQLQEELTASENKVASLEETLNNKEQEIRQHEEALRTAIEHVFTNVDLNHLVYYLKCLPPRAQLVVSSPPVFECNNGYSLEGNDICELSEKDDEEASPPDHYNSQYSHRALVTNNLFIDEWNYYSYIPMKSTSYCSQVSTDIPPMDFIPYSLEILKYHDRLVVSPLFLPFFPPPPPLIELHLIPT